MASYTRNIQGVPVTLTLIEVDPMEVRLDPTNPRVGFSMRQLDQDDRNDPACVLLLTSQEDTEGLKRSIVLSGGVQEPVYLRSDMTVAEGNRRVVAMRAAAEDHPDRSNFRRMPAWLFPAGLSEVVIQDLLNEIHLGSVRGWAPYEKALQMRGLVKTGLVHEEIAERYRMTSMEVRQHIEAADLMDRLYFPITSDPADAEHRLKFTYFLEFLKSPKLRRQAEADGRLSQKFAHWVSDGKVDKAVKVRRLAKILEHEDAMKVLEADGFDAADRYIVKADPKEQELYAVMDKACSRLRDLTATELIQLAESDDRQAILADLRGQIDLVLESASRFADRRQRVSA